MRRETGVRERDSENTGVEERVRIQVRERDRSIEGERDRQRDGSV